VTQTAADAEVLEEIVPGSADVESPDAAEKTSEQAEDVVSAPEFVDRPMIPVALLAAHPENVREDKQPTEAFCRTVAEVGILTPLEIAVRPDGSYRVVDGEVRLNTALKLGLEEVPYFFSEEASANEALQYLHMVITAKHRQGLSSREVAAGLFKASEHGMTRTAIRKATGMSAQEVRDGVRAGGLSASAKQVAAEMDYEWTLEELALLRQFEDDPEALEVIRRAASSRYNPLKYTIQRLVDDRAARAVKAKMIAELEAAGITVTEDKPEGAVALNKLLSGQEEMDVQAHGECPGRGAYIGHWLNAQPNHYCLDPVAHGHVFKSTGTTTPPEPPTPAPASAEAAAQAAEEKERAKRERKIIVEGNKAWVAAAKVRRQWLAEFFAHKTPPRNVAQLIARFVTEQLVTMPEPLRDALGGANGSQQFARLGGPTPKTVAASSQPGLWMLALVPIVTAYEQQLCGYSERPNDNDGGRTNTWRDARYSPCTRNDAATYLRFIIELGAKHGFEPSMIERSVAEDFTYRGDNPEPEEPQEETEEPADDAVVAGITSQDESIAHGDEGAPEEDPEAPRPAEPGLEAETEPASDPDPDDLAATTATVAHPAPEAEAGPSATTDDFVGVDAA
jgi:ParB-like chromosome segregation protein Spo0J